MSVSQQWNQQELDLQTGTYRNPDRSSEAFVASRLSESPTGEIRLLESILERDNMEEALRRVVANKGAPGVDGMKVGQLGAYLKRHWPKIRESLLDGSYEPMPAMRKEVEKKDGGVRLLGIPTVLDRLIQQAIARVLGKLWDHGFSDSSFGFRPKRSQREAIEHCRSHLSSGLRYCVDIDLSKWAFGVVVAFAPRNFDRVNHDRLMHRLSLKINDKRVLRLIRRYLESGVMIEGVRVYTEEGTPQGGPLSPLLSNIVLDELDKELENRQLKFARYADDCVIYVGSKRAGERVMRSVSRFIVKRLRLKVNEEKSSVGRPWKSKYLGFCMTDSRKAPKIAIHWKTTRALKDKIKELTKRTIGRSPQRVVAELSEYLRGWWGYYGLIDSLSQLSLMGNWIRRRLRSLLWKQWKNRRTRVRELRKRGISKHMALRTGCSRKGAWRMSQVKWVMIALPNRHFTSLGLVIPWV